MKTEKKDFSCLPPNFIWKAGTGQSVIKKNRLPCSRHTKVATDIRQFFLPDIRLNSNIKVFSKKCTLFSFQLICKHFSFFILVSQTKKYLFVIFLCYLCYILLFHLSKLFLILNSCSSRIAGHPNIRQLKPDIRLDTEYQKRLEYPVQP